MSQDQDLEKLKRELDNLDNIWKNVNEMITYLTKGRGSKDDETVAKKFEWLQTYYPRLYSSIYLDQGNFDTSKLRYMINQRKRILQNEITEHQASVDVGENLADQYLYSKVSRPEPKR